MAAMTGSGLDLATRSPYHADVLSDPKLFINRELSWLAFNGRVLEEAKCAALPLFERLKFLGIVASNLDEFFMVRVAGLKQQQLAGSIAEPPADGMSPTEQLASIQTAAHALVTEQYRVWNAEIMPALRDAGLVILGREPWSNEQKAGPPPYLNPPVFPAPRQQRPRRPSRLGRTATSVSSHLPSDLPGAFADTSSQPARRTCSAAVLAGVGSNRSRGRRVRSRKTPG